MAQQYDIVLANGRVMDPASNLDAVRFVESPAARSLPSPRPR